MAADAPSAPRPGSPRKAVQGSNRAGRRHARGVHGRRAPAAVSLQARRRRRDHRGEPRDAEPRRRRVHRRGNRGLRAVERADLLHGLGRGARARRSADSALQPSPATLARLLRAQPHRRDRQPHHERHRGPRPTRDGRRLEPRPELARPRRDGDRALPPRLAPRAGDAHRAPADGARDRVVPVALQPCVQAGPRAARARHGDAGRGHLGHARRPVLHARADEPVDLPRRESALPRLELRDGRRQQLLLPGRRHPLVRRDGDRARRRELARRRRADDDRNAPGLHALPRELLRPGATALAALQHLSLRDRRARPHHQRPRRGAGHRGRAGRGRAAEDRGARPLRACPLRVRRSPRRPARLRPRRSRRHDRGARRAHRRREVHDREAARALLRPARRTHHDRRHRPAPGHAGVAPPAARDRAAGGLPLRRVDRRQHRLRTSGRVARRDRAGRGGGRRGRVHRGAARRATTRRSASADSSSHSGSASSSRSREHSWRTRGSSSSTRRPRRSTSAPSGASTSGSAGS